MTPIFAMKPEDWERTSVSSGQNTAELMRIKYIGSEVAAHVSIAATTGDITFEQGPNTTSAVVGIGDNPGTTGVIDLSALTPKTFHSLQLEINSVADWECWLTGALPDDAPEASGTGYPETAADLDCTGSSGAAIPLEEDNSDWIVAGLTFWKESSEPHNHDGNVLHELLQVKCTLSYTGVLTIVVFECDDIAGTSVAKLTLAGVAASGSETAFPSDAGIGEPIMATKSKRLVVKATGGTTIATDAINSLFILGRSYSYGPGVRKSKLQSSE